MCPNLFVSFMAAPLKRGSNPENGRSISKQRHGHDRQAIETIRRRETHTRRQQGERRRDQSTRPSPPRQTQRPLQQQQLPTPMITPSSSTLSLNAQVEHARSLPMERTPSGNSIISDNTFEPRHDNTLPTCSDEQAARWVEEHFKRLPPHGKSERILRHLINSRVPVDSDALDGILTTADCVFFNGVLSGRVRWEWSHPSQERYKTELIGTTALRPAAQGGYETLIILSAPILRNPAYDRRLLLSAFLHELIHCYLFILCGFRARIKGGHTHGFHQIAEIIDTWVGVDNLRLCNMKANLNHFRKDRPNFEDPRMEGMRNGRHSHEGCNQSPRPERDFEEGVVSTLPIRSVDGYI